MKYVNDNSKPGLFSYQAAPFRYKYQKVLAALGE